MAENVLIRVIVVENCEARTLVWFFLLKVDIWGEVRLIFKSAEEINNPSTKLQCGIEGLVWCSMADIPHVSKFCVLRNSQKACPGPGFCCGGEAMLP